MDDQPTITFADGDAFVYVVDSLEDYLVTVTLHDGNEFNGYLSNDEDALYVRPFFNKAATEQPVRIEWEQVGRLHIH